MIEVQKTKNKRHKIILFKNKDLWIKAIRNPKIKKIGQTIQVWHIAKKILHKNQYSKLKKKRLDNHLKKINRIGVGNINCQIMKN